jgi:hypothetical protein
MAPIFNLEDSRIQSGDIMPTMLLCNAATPPTCSGPYAPSNGVNDFEEPCITYQNDYGYVGGTRDVELNFATNCGTNNTGAMPLNGSLNIQHLDTPSCSCTCSPSGSNSQRYRMAAGDAAADTAITKGWTAFSPELSCGLSQSVPDSAHTCTVTCNPVAGAQMYDFAGRTSGAEAQMSRQTASSFTDDGSITPSGSLNAINDTGAVIAGSKIYSSTAASLSGGGSLSTGSNSFAGRITGAASSGNVLTPGFVCPNAVQVSLTDETTSGTAKVTAQSPTTVTFSATPSDTVDYIASCR